MRLTIFNKFNSKIYTHLHQIFVFKKKFKSKIDKNAIKDHQGKRYIVNCAEKEEMLQ